MLVRIYTVTTRR